MVITWCDRIYRALCRRHRLDMGLRSRRQFLPRSVHHGTLGYTDTCTLWSQLAHTFHRFGTGMCNICYIWTGSHGFHRHLFNDYYEVKAILSFVTLTFSFPSIKKWKFGDWCVYYFTFALEHSGRWCKNEIVDHFAGTCARCYTWFLVIVLYPVR